MKRCRAGDWSQDATMGCCAALRAALLRWAEAHSLVHDVDLMRLLGHGGLVVRRLAVVLVVVVVADDDMLPCARRRAARVARLLVITVLL